MNIEKYTKIISRYNNVYNAKAHDTNIIVLPFSEFKWSSKFLSRIQKFDKVVYNCKRPIVRAFKSFYRTDCITSVFLQNKTHSIIMGNERILFSHPEGNIFLCLTPFWVKDASFIHLLGSDNIFPYKNVVLFLDELQIPYPGGSYYCKKNRSETIAVEPSNIDKYMRICFITRDLSTLEDMFITWNGRPNVKNFPFLTKSTILSISKFINPSPLKIQFHNFPEKVIKSTNLISKKLSHKDPNFLIQDILNTYRNSSGSIDNVGLFIEYPFECDYENSCGNGGSGSTCTPIIERRSNDNLEQYAAFYINGLNPKKILQVRRPYDRYLEYENYVPEIDMHSWTNILYDPNEIIPIDVSRVILDHTILGYKYKNAFLCLPFPGLSNGGSGGGDFICGITSQTDCLLTPMKEVDLLNDSNIYIIDEYPYDDDHKLYQIQHRGIRNDLWCLGNKNSKEEFINANGEPPSKYPRKADPPLFVTKWLQFYNQNKDKKDLNFGELDQFKLALILARHKICFKLKRGDKRELKLINGEYEIRLEEQLVNYINEIRLLPLDGSSSTNTETNTNERVNDENFDYGDEDSNQGQWCKIS